MIPAPLPDNEPQRLTALHSYHILDTAPDLAFDEIADLAAEICETPIALVSLVDESRQWFKANPGLSVRETARSVAFCAHAILQDDVFVVPDALEDERFADNPLVTGPPNIRFYAGAPLFTEDGCGLGTLCVIDQKPRSFTPHQRKALSVLRRHVLNLMELRRQNQELRALNSEVQSFGYACSHDLVAPIRRIVSFCRILNEDFAPALKEDGGKLLERIERSALDMRDLIDGLLTLSQISRLELNATRIDLGELAAAVVDELKSNDSQRKVETRIAPDLSVYGDRRLLRIALTNLLSNAWKFTAKRPVAKIDIGAQERNGERFFYVRDNGVGFDGAYADKLFMPFKRLHTEDEFAGAGIGLATVRRIIERHGGELAAEAAPGEGATFYFKL